MDNTRLWHVAASQAWQLATLVAAVYFITRLMARNRPQLAYALWLVVLVKCVTPPLWSSPTGIFCWLQGSSAGDTTEVVTAPPVPNAALSEYVVGDSVTGGQVAELSTLSAELLGSPTIQAPNDLENNPSPQPDAWAGRLSLSQALLAVWIAGTVLIAAVAVIRVACCVRRFRRHACVASDDLERRLADLAKRFGLRRRVRLLVTASPIGPAVVGFFRPTIVLPARLVEARGPSHLEPIIAHELAHVRRGDLWAGLLQVVAQAVWWFHPFVWLAGRMHAREAERCCDEDVVVELGFDSVGYARALLDVLELRRELVAVPAFPGVRPVELTTQRLERIMTLGQGSRRNRRWWSRLAMLMTAAAVLPGAALIAADTEPTSGAYASTPETEEVEEQLGVKGQLEETVIAAKDEPQVTRTYDVAELLVIYGRQTGVNDKVARTCLLSQLELALDNEAQFASCTRGYWATPTGKGEFTFKSNDGAQTITLPTVNIVPPGLHNRGKPTCKWSGTSIVVQCPADQHPRVAKAIDDLRHCDFGHEIELTTRWATADGQHIDERFIDSLSPSWKLLTSAAQAADAWSEEPAAGETQATFRVERTLPVKFAILDEHASEAALEKLQGHRRVNLLQAPRLRFPSGQTATVQDMKYSPFVVDVREVRGSTGVANEPVIRVYSQGTAMRVRGLRHEKSVRLDFDLAFSAIRDVETAEVVFGGGRDPVTLQVPEVARMQLRSSIDVPLGKTLVIAGLKSFRRDGKPQPAAVLLSVKEPSDTRAGAPRQPEAQTSRLMLGEGVNSDAGLVGNIVADAARPPEAAAKDGEVDADVPVTTSEFLNKRPGKIRYVRIYGGSTAEKTLLKKAGLKVGEPLDPRAVEEGRRKLESYLKSKAFTTVSVKILEGQQPTDGGVRLLVNEGQKSKQHSGIGVVLPAVADKHMAFVASGDVDQAKLDEYAHKLTDYYRSLGFFRARVGREWTYNEKSQTMQVKYLVDEHERYVIDKIEVVGNVQIPFDRIAEGHKLKAGDFYNKAALDKEVARIKDVCGDEGYLFAAVEPETRFHEQPGKLDLVFRITESARFRIRSIDFALVGEGQADRRAAILQLLPIADGDIACATKLRHAERMLRADGEISLADDRPPQVVLRPTAETTDTAPDDVLHTGETLSIDLAPAASSRSVDTDGIVR